MLNVSVSSACQERPWLLKTCQSRELTNSHCTPKVSATADSSQKPLESRDGAWNKPRRYLNATQVGRKTILEHSCCIDKCCKRFLPSVEEQIDQSEFLCNQLSPIKPISHTSRHSQCSRRRQL